MRGWRSDGHFFESSRIVEIVDDEWMVILSIEPNPVLHGQEFTLRDMSVVPPGRKVVERQMRWLPSRRFVNMEGEALQHHFATPGARRVIVRLLDDQGEFHYGQAAVTILEEPENPLNP